MRKFRIISYLLILLNGILLFQACQQNKAATIEQTLTGNDSLAISALVLYPDTIRNYIFEVCKYPKAMRQIADLQESSSDQFNKIIESYPQDEQEEIWDLTRYPGLIHRMQGLNTEKGIQLVLNDYPDDIHSTAIKYGTTHQDLIKQVDELQTESDEKFEKIIEDYPTETQTAFREIVKLPEVLSILDSHNDMAENLGKIYERDPEQVKRMADSLHLAVAKQNAEDIASWKEELNADPEAQEELKAAAGEYAAENGYEEAEYSSAPSYYYVHEYTWYPYPYWFGYPYWYPYDYWYPYPYWYDWGFYYDAYGNIVVISTPSYAFAYWYFYYPHNYYSHPHIANAFINYYYGPHVHGDQNAVIVRNWVDDNRKYLPANFIDNNKNRPDAIRDFGKLEADWQKYRDESKGEHLSQDAYFTQHKNDYPALQSNSGNKIEKNEPGIIQRKTTNQKQPPVKQPHVKMNPNKPANENGKTPERINRNYDFEQVNPAQQRHRDMWDQNQRTDRPRRQNQPRNKSGGGRY